MSDCPLVCAFVRVLWLLVRRNLDVILAQKIALPAGHVPINPYVCFNKTVPVFTGPCITTVLSYHPLIDASFANSSFPVNHTSIHYIFAPYLPAEHA